MKTGRAGRVLSAGLVVLGGAVAVLWACGDPGSIHGTVTESLHGHLLPWATMLLEHTANPPWIISTATGEAGTYQFTGLAPDGYEVTAISTYYQAETASVSVGTGASVTQDFVLDPIAANIKADVISVDQSNAGRTGGCRSVQVKITFQTTSQGGAPWALVHQPRRLVLWAWNASRGKAYVIADSGEVSWTYFYSCLDSTVSPNMTVSGFDSVATLRLDWNTTVIPNGAYTLKAALKCLDPHGDGSDEDPDPQVESWVHWGGGPPTEIADGTPGGSTLGIDVANVVITSYAAKDTALDYHPQDAFKYDPDGASPLCNPSFDVSIDNWTSAPMVIRVWMAATAWADTRPVPEYDPYVDLGVNAAGAYTLTWDGSNPGYPEWEGEWGTWSFDVDVYCTTPSLPFAITWFYAKTHDGWTENYDVLIDPVNHHVWWYWDETATPPAAYQFRCNYIVHSDEATPPSAVDLVTLKELAAKASLSLTANPPPAPSWTDLDTLHDNITTYPGSGHTNPDDIVGTWRTVFTGQTASGAEHRRDGTNPRILATNGVGAREVPLVLVYAPTIGSQADLNWARDGIIAAGLSCYVTPCALVHHELGVTCLGYSVSPSEYYNLIAACNAFTDPDGPCHIATVACCGDVELADTTSFRGNIQYPDRCVVNFANVDSHAYAIGKTAPQKFAARTRVVMHEAGHAAGKPQNVATVCHFGAEAPVHCGAPAADLKCVMRKEIKPYFWEDLTATWPPFAACAEHTGAKMREHTSENWFYWPMSQ